jgi:Uncharacterized conserved protein
MKQSNIWGALVPHSPTLLEDEMNTNDSSIIKALRNLGNRLRIRGINVIIAATAHWQTEGNFFIDNSPVHNTLNDYFGFTKDADYDAVGHPEIARYIQEAGNRNLIFPKFRKYGIDHAITIPLHFMFPEYDIPVIPISVSGTSICAFRWGRTIGSVLKELDIKALFMASGSLTHNPYYFTKGEFNQEHALFDRKVLDFISNGKGMDLLKIDPRLIKEAQPEGGFRDLFMLMGAMGSQSYGKIKAYERLPGVGMSVVEFEETNYNDKDNELLMFNKPSGILH